MRINREIIQEIEGIDNHNHKMYAAARMYVDAGFYVIPIRPDEKAAPPKRYGITYDHATKRPALIDKWYGEGGKFEGWNIGLACGHSEGLFVVDIDKENKKGNNGFAEFGKIVPEGWKYGGPVQTTPNSGNHLLFKWREHARCTSEKICPGVDTRGGLSNKAQGHIVVWPSMVDGARYSWIEFGPVEDCPDWIIELLGMPFNSTKKSGRGNEHIGDADYEDKFTIDKIQEMLEVINPDDLSYDEWLQIGQAIHTQHPDDSGLALWDNWSQAGDRYERGECGKRWSGFNSGGTIRIGTLIAYAMRRGYDLAKLEEARIQYDDKIEALIDSMNKTYSICPMGSDIMVIERCAVVPEMAPIQPRYRFWKKAGFRNYFENQVTTSITHEGKPKKMSHADIWLGHPNRETYPSGVGLFPDKPERYHGYFNLWQGFAVVPKRGEWERFRRHIYYVICNKDKELYEWVLDWIADLLQDPGNPKGTAIVLHGIEGCGKGTFCDVLGQIFGSHYKHLTDQEHLVGRFNGHLADAIFVFADEAVFGGDRKIAGKLKALVTEQILTSERKGVDAIQFRNCAHLVAASNESWFIPAGPQSRRWLVLDVSGHHANDIKYFENIYQEARMGGAAAMMYDLLNRKVKVNLRKAPITKALQLQREQYSAMDSAVEWWTDQLSLGALSVPSITADQQESPPWPEEISKSDVLVRYRKWCSENRRRQVSNTRLFVTLKRAGLDTSRLSLAGQRIYAFRVPPHATCEEIARREFGYALERTDE